jgi:hypothetical protein
MILDKANRKLIEDYLEYVYRTNSYKDPYISLYINLANVILTIDHKSRARYKIEKDYA